MKQRRFTEEQIIGVLKEGGGADLICRSAVHSGIPTKEPRGKEHVCATLCLSWHRMR